MESIVPNASPLMQEKFVPLPLGAVKPSGWLKDQLRVQANGLTGHIDEFWPDLSPDNAWLGGKVEGWERGPYYLDGLVPLAYLLDDEGLKKKAQKWLDYILDHQHADGWLGPIQGVERGAYDHWPNTIVLKVLTQYHEATGDARVIPVMTRYCAWLRDKLDEYKMHSWGMFRWQDLVMSIHWLYNRTKESWLLDLAGKVHDQGYDWLEHFRHFKFIKKIPKKEKCELKTHVVNNAQAVKTAAVWFTQTKDPKDKAMSRTILAKLDKYHGTVVGTFTGDEHYAGKDPSQGTELCAVAEYMFSLEVMMSVLGEVSLGDRLERIAYNAFPATFKPDMWAHQYDQQANQVLCTVAQRQWTNNGPESNTFGLEPNFGCCTANMHQGWPKFVSHMWMATHDGGVALMTHGPSELKTTLPGGTQVAITSETIYPFNGRVRLMVGSKGKFPLYIRIPSWCRNPAAAVNGKPVTCNAGRFLRITRKWKPGDTIDLTFPMALEFETRYHDAVAVKRGPLVYSLKLGEEWKQIKGEAPHADWEVYPTTPWNFGLEVNLADPSQSLTVSEVGHVGPTPFDPEAAPVAVKARGRIVKQWEMVQNSAGPLPQSPVDSTEPSVELTLIPYGSTNLRVTEFPRIK